MASYNTVPAAEEPLLQEPIKKSSRKYVVLGAALASFALGALAVTATSPEVASTGMMSKFYGYGGVYCMALGCGPHSGSHSQGNGICKKGKWKGTQYGYCKSAWTSAEDGSACEVTQYGCADPACDNDPEPWCMIDDEHWCHCK